MTATFKVKPGVSLPPSPKTAGPSPRYPYEQIAVGEMFFAPRRTTDMLSSYMSKVGRRLGKKFTTQTAVMRQDLQTNEWEVCKPGDAGACQGVAVTRVK